MSDGYYLGGLVDPTIESPAEAPVHYDGGDLTTHGVIVGMTGSGKTGLGVIFLEEALRSGVPALILDPKGDMTNLLLTFPELRPSDFRPWIDEANVARRWPGTPPTEATSAFAAAPAERVVVVDPRGTRHYDDPRLTTWEASAIQIQHSGRHSGNRPHPSLPANGHCGACRFRRQRHRWHWMASNCSTGAVTSAGCAVSSQPTSCAHRSPRSVGMPACFVAATGHRPYSTRWHRP